MIHRQERLKERKNKKEQGKKVMKGKNKRKRIKEKKQ